MKFIILLLLSASPLVEAKTPKNAHPVSGKPWPWECDHGYVQDRDQCSKVRVPRHGVLTPDGHGWECPEGREKYRGGCRKVKKK